MKFLTNLVKAGIHVSAAMSITFLVAVCVCAAYSWFTWRSPTDAQMIEQFQKHQKEFNELARFFGMSHR